jgi:hypothetical protein
MKKIGILNLILFSSILSVSSFAHAGEQVDCVTLDHNYTISIGESQPAAADGKVYYPATIMDANHQTVASYEVYLYTGIQSVSFGRHPLYLDKETDGKSFSLAGPSSNVHKFEIHALMNTEGRSEKINSDVGCSGPRR